jgi:hypothetical protein
MYFIFFNEIDGIDPGMGVVQIKDTIVPAGKSTAAQHAACACGS